MASNFDNFDFYKRRLYRWRRDVGFFQEKRERFISRNSLLEASNLQEHSISCTVERNYAVTLITKEPSRVSLSIQRQREPAKTICTDSPKRTHQIIFFSKLCNKVKLTITSQETYDITIESVKIKMEGGGNCEYLELKTLFKEGQLYEVSRQLQSNQLPSLTTKVKGMIDLYENGIPSQKIPPMNTNNNSPYLYLLHSAYNFNLSGYTSRSHSILKHLKAYAYTRLGYPYTVSHQLDKNKHLLSKPIKSIDIDNVSYHTVLDEELDYTTLTTRKYIEHNVNILCKQYRKSVPKAVIAASSYINGYVGYLTSRKLNVPFAYEMRGLWHISETSKNAPYADSDQYKLAELSEIDLANKAEQVFVLSRAMKQWLIQRGVSSSKIMVTPNGVNTQRFRPAIKPRKLLKKHKLKGKHVFGFIGSLTEYEGVDMLISVFIQLTKKYNDIALLIAGSGPHYKTIKSAGLSNPNIHILGSIPHDQILPYYHLCDTLVYARTNDEVCNLVPPLKPLEAMAAEKLVICSDVPPLLDYINNGKNGIAFQVDSFSSLNQAMQEAIEGGAHIEQMKKNARTYVKDHHQWATIAKKLSFCD